MGNVSNRDQWSVRERLGFIERTAWWRGFVNRSDLREVFGISAAQASADLQLYQEMNPGALVYNLNAKRYEAGAAMACVLHDPQLSEAVRLFLGERAPFPQQACSAGEDAKVDVSVAPARRASCLVERRVFLAMQETRRLRVKYWSIHSNRGRLRDIAPHALGHDGYRWHARAWCFEDATYKDFVLSRIETADWPGEIFDPPVADVEWNRFVEVDLIPNRALGEDQRKAIERDYGMTGGQLKLRVREAMLEYCLGHLRVRGADGRPEHLELARAPGHLRRGS